ncbi:unnamed protein product [Caenorhabditis bovis]|uniref:Uncharacterized protein n=1 Tax=Caenorhabditis bovis TaxID=2654633 RepID=A0A8S1EZ93_9PELO|nr:unnamed protein product [Caenorhabditis bovis]
MNESPNKFENSRIDTNHFSITRQKPATIKSSKDHIYISRKTNIEQQVKEAESLLNNSFSSIYVHGMGASINKALVFAMEVERNLHGSVKSDILTSTVQVSDVIFSYSDEFESGIRNRPLSAVHIHIYRCDS